MTIATIEAPPTAAAGSGGEAPINIDTITLTQGQQNALEAFLAFLMDPNETCFVLRGFAGCGKSTLVRTLLDRLPAFQRTVKLINPSAAVLTPALTATVNKACEALQMLTGQEVVTIHSFLGIRVQTDYRTGESMLAVGRGHGGVTGHLIFIDEASYVDSNLLQLIFKQTKDCKLVFIGDPAQLTPVKSNATPVFDTKWPGAALTEVVRQAAGNPILDVCTKLRHTVQTGEWLPFTPDGQAIVHVGRDEFNDRVLAEFTRPDWRYSDSKVLAWTNKTVVAYNQYVRDRAKGDPLLQAGDYAVVNSYCMQPAARVSLKTDQLVYISEIGPDTLCLGIPGNWVTLDKGVQWFHPKTLAQRNAALKEARANNDLGACQQIEQSWVDLRGAYACTVNKSQGSTFDRVFIDLDDISRCHNANQVARMLYVGISRARFQVILTGDIA